MNAAAATKDLLRQALQQGSIHLLSESPELSALTEGLLCDFPERVHLVPAADAAIVGLATGLAMAQQRVVIELAGPDALWGAAQQLGQEAAQLHGEFNAAITILVPMAPGERAPDLSPIDNVTFAHASNGPEVVDLLNAAMNASHPVVLFIPRAVLLESVSDRTALPLGKARVLRTGDHATVLAWGRAATLAEVVADELNDSGMSVGVIDLRTINPLDTETVAEHVNHTGRPVLVNCPAAVLPDIVQCAFLRFESPPVSAKAERNALKQAIQESIYY